MADVFDVQNTVCSMRRMLGKNAEGNDMSRIS